MTMPEWFAEYELNRVDDGGTYAGKLTRGDVDELWEWAHGDS